MPPMPSRNARGKDNNRRTDMPGTHRMTAGEPEQRRKIPRRLRLDVVREAGDWAAFEPVEAAVDEIAAALDCSNFLNLPNVAEACIALSNDAAVRGLNREYRGLDKTTNVLSFAAAAPGAPQPAEQLGDIVLAVETVTREASEAAIPPRHHFQHLVLHGILHLLGYDHEEEEQAAEMERTEIKILASLGIADPYRDEEAA